MDNLNEPTRYTVCVTKQDEGQRADKFLSNALPELTRSRIQQLLEEGHITLDGAPLTSPSKKVKDSQTFVIAVPPSVEAIPEAEDIPLDIIYEDQDLVVINKPPGMVVHPAPGNPNQTLVNALLAHCGDSLSGINGVKRPGIVHRLDKGTSGLLVAAKNDQAHQRLSHQLSNRTMSTYQAVVWGVPSPRAGTITGAIGRSRRDRKKMAIVSKGGKEATTHYTVEKAYKLLASLVRCQLETGRTHQIRVHLTSLGHSLVGDPTYGRRPKQLAEDLKSFLVSPMWPADRVALHAAELKFIHPTSQEEMVFTAPLPGDIRALLDVLECQ